jgi:hypothetical protein
MVKEISGSFSPVTDARSRDLNFDSGSRGDRGGITGDDDSDISFSITFLGFSHAYEGVLSMASYTHLEMENEISESSSPVITRTSTLARKVMDNEISESSSPIITRTSTLARKVPLLFLRMLMYV